MYFTDRGIEELEHRRGMNRSPSAGSPNACASSSTTTRSSTLRSSGSRPGSPGSTKSDHVGWVTRRQDLRLRRLVRRRSRRPEGAGLGRSGGGEDPAVDRCRPDCLPARRPGPDDRGHRRSNATGVLSALCSRRRTRRGARGRRRGRLHRLPGGPVGRHPRVRPAVDAGSASLSARHRSAQRRPAPGSQSWTTPTPRSAAASTCRTSRRTERWSNAAPGRRRTSLTVCTPRRRVTGCSPTSC